MKLQFSSIHKDNRFDIAFSNLDESNGVLEFKRQRFATGGMVVLYAPNGTGKTSFSNVLKAEDTSEDTSFSAIDENGNEIIPESKAFHVIADQISRNIIKGDESQYLVGRDIRREYELKKRVNAGFNQAFQLELPRIYKEKYNVTTVNALLLSQIERENPRGYIYIKSIVNKSSRGKDINRSEFIEYITNLNLVEELALDEEKLQYVIKDFSKAKIIDALLCLNLKDVVPNENVSFIEQHDDAIRFLDKYKHLDCCIVCDNHDFNGDELLSNKISNRRQIYDGLSQVTKTVLDKIVLDESLENNDPFNIKRIVLNFINGEDALQINELKNELKTYVNKLIILMLNDLKHCFDDTSMFSDFEELTSLQEVEPELDSDDLLYIQKIISENIDREIYIIRDDGNDRNFKLMLGSNQLLNVERDEMELSTGEQNFISLAFELLLAKNSNAEYIVLDDPISSFDSLYKNKIAFCLVKFLENKKQIILTHNLDLVRLLEVQLNGCYNFYMLNNSEGGRNGFIRVNAEEQKFLINLSELIALLQNKDGILLDNIQNRRLFLISMVPFMRGYAHILRDENDYYGALSNIMHGYGTREINLVPIYNDLFGMVFEGEEIVSVNDILSLNFDNIEIIDSNCYPLLSETLKQTLIYYHLRMLVEKKLMDIFHISVGENEILMLNRIIQSAFRCNDINNAEYRYKRECRAFFTSRKTLLNEFNHFEGNMNIFQPAIDINTNKLHTEIISIKEKLHEIESHYRNV